MDSPGALIAGFERCFSCVLPLLVMICLLSPLTAAAEATPTPEPEEHVFVLKEYRYVADQGGEDDLTGLMLCKNRCHALSVDYLNYTTPGGWYLQRVAVAKQVAVNLDNPFLQGKCICVADEFVVKVNDLYMVKPEPYKAPEKPTHN